MSFDETKHSDNDEIDLSQLFSIVWSFKYSLLIFIILSVPLSIGVSTSLKPTYIAETVFEKPIYGSARSNNGILDGAAGFQFMSLFSGGMAGGASDSFISEIRSDSFLETVIINNAKLDSQMMKEFCPLPSKETSKFSLRSVLISLGILENKDPSESQKISLLVQCVNKMFEIEIDNKGIGETSAYRLSIESGNPYFSANLANEIVDKYFTRHKNKRDTDFQNVKTYLSKVIAEAQMEFVEANELMQRFKIKNTLLMNLKLPQSNNLNTSLAPGGINSSIPVIPLSPFALELDKEIANLSELEKSLNKLKNLLANLLNLETLDQEKIKPFISSIEFQGVLSRVFITSISKIDNLSVNASFKNQEIKKLVGQELRRLKQQIQVLEDKKVKLEDKTMQLMTIDNRFRELAIDVSKKQMIFEGLKDQLKEKIFTTGLANVHQPVLLTKAVPPFKKDSPNTLLIVVLGVVLTMFAGIAYILITQVFMRKVHSLSQLQNISRFLNCYEIKYKQLMQMGERSDVTVISQSFFSLTRQMGNFGCVIDLSQKKRNDSLASKFSSAFATFLATDSSKIVCLDASPSKTSLSDASLQKNYSSDHRDFDAQGILRKNILRFDDKDDIILAGEIKKIKNEYSEYDKIICSLGAQIGDLTKFKFIEQCDFYILIGRSFQFDEYTYKKFSNTVWEKEKKCLGFFLIS